MNYLLNDKGGWIVPDNTVIENSAQIPAYSVIGDGCELGNDCILGNDCSLDDWCRLGERCRLGNDCTMGNYCILGNDCSFGDGCSLGYWCRLGERCSLGNDCTLGNCGSLGDWCSLGERCSLGYDCSLGYWCSLGDGCQWLGVKVIKWLTMANVDGYGRQLKIIRHADGVKIEAGCFCGDSSDFIARAENEGKRVYVDVVGAVIKALMEIKL